jgi:hypothetical protein
MQDFRCYFLDEQDHIIFPAEITAHDLEAAKRHAFGMFEAQEPGLECPVQAIEIWQSDVRLYRT